MEPEQQTQQPTTSSPSKLVIILLILIVSAGGYLAYAIYNESTKTSSETSTEPAPITNNPPTNTSTESNVTEPASTSEMVKTDYTLADVAKNNTPALCWTIIDGTVYNITSYIPNHPGGPAEISQICGRDGSELFAKPAQHASSGAKDILAQFEIGKLVQ